ncbi:hypothetical protein KBB27_01160 [Patescibacteria group bacterium]|nr:hypothetical protein [Patescibacteria group bacterium]
MDPGTGTIFSEGRTGETGDPPSTAAPYTALEDAAEGEEYILRSVAQREIARRCGLSDDATTEAVRNLLSGGALRQEERIIEGRRVVVLVFSSVPANEERPSERPLPETVSVLSVAQPLKKKAAAVRSGMRSEASKVSPVVGAMPCPQIAVCLLPEERRIWMKLCEGARLQTKGSWNPSESAHALALSVPGLAKYVGLRDTDSRFNRVLQRMRGTGLLVALRNHGFVVGHNPDNVEVVPIEVRPLVVVPEKVAKRFQKADARIVSMTNENGVIPPNQRARLYRILAKMWGISEAFAREMVEDRKPLESADAPFIPITVSEQGELIPVAQAFRPFDVVAGKGKDVSVIYADDPQYRELLADVLVKYVLATEK